MTEELPSPASPSTDAEARFEDYFREGAAPQDQQLLWQLTHQHALIDALRALFHGSESLVRLRLWVFMELMTLPSMRIERDDLNRHFHVLREEALDLALKRLREAGLLHWDGTAQHYTVPPLAQQLVGMLASLTQTHNEDADLTALLAGVAGNHQLGTLDSAHLHHLQAQLARLHDEFADAIASGSEFALRHARRRFDRALTLVDKASQALSAIINDAKGEAKLERLARSLGLAQARLLSMTSQFNRALQQADRQRLTLGSSGINTTDVKVWLQGQQDLAALLKDLLAHPVTPVFVAGLELVDVAEAEFERDRAKIGDADPLPASQAAPHGAMETMALPIELSNLVKQLASWNTDQTHDLQEAVLNLPARGERYAQAAYRMQLMPLLGDAQAQGLQGSTGDLARSPWRAVWRVGQHQLTHEAVAAISPGWLLPPDMPAPDEPDESISPSPLAGRAEQATR